MTSNNKTTKLLKYNPLWVDSVFTTRSKTEQLLAPERELGNISHHDYEAAVAFFPNYHRHLAIVGFLLGSISPFAIRHPRINGRRPFIIAVLGPLGFAIGGGLRMASHARFLSSIQDPDGFEKAMKNIEKVYPPRSEPIMGRTYSSNADDVDLSTNHAIVLPSADIPQGHNKMVEHPSKPRSKWEELRQANAKSTETSSWDALRQKYERQKIGPQESASPQEEGDEFAMKDSGDKYR
ncbi:hypothetical protein CVT24_001066 [Panaeolus cyanescens]|uniref:Uncharacterized protein n=1 Tax=Panaeolus cyanescens TaxID=181874 RepID=A0A409VX04_9AGAR|nr:hypothetical protein CVT24_001066 [Panaeolus cyanescens]